MNTTAREPRRSILVLIFGLCVFGCARHESPDSMSGLRAQVVEGPPPAKERPPGEGDVEFTFLKPDRREFQVGQPIDVRLIMKVKDEKMIPAHVNVLLRRNAVNVGSSSTHLRKEEEGRVFTFEATIEAPQEPGRYRLHVEAIRVTFYRQEAQKPVSRQDTIRSQGLDLTIKKRRGGT